MLKKRIITAVILIPLVLLAIFYLSDRGFAMASGAFFLLALWEWATLTSFSHPAKKVIYLIASIGLMVGSLWLAPIWIYTLAMAWWAIAIAMVLRFPKGSALWAKYSWLPPLVGLLVLLPCWVAINGIRQLEHGIPHLVMLFVLVWGADTGAYFVGKKWGHTKLAFAVSPGKTVEGFLGGLLSALIFAAAISLWKETFVFDIPFYLVLVCFVVVISVFGDLFESVVKRVCGVKDSGHMLPGHGGILDRIDALTAAAPAFGLGLWLLGYH